MAGQTPAQRRANGADPERATSVRSFPVIALVVFLGSYLTTVVLFGIAWDPNGAELLSRPPAQTIGIVLKGLLLVWPLALGTFIVDHPVAMITGLVFAAIAVLAWSGRQHAVCRAIGHVLIGGLTVLGTVRLFLLA